MKTMSRALEARDRASFLNLLPLTRGEIREREQPAESCDLVIAGGGPAGLASAIAAAERGIRSVVLERKSEPADKACGEGLLPSALKALERLGVRRLIDTSQCFPFSGIRFINEDGSSAEGKLPDGGGLGVPRVALMSALIARAAELGVEIRDRCAVVGFRRRDDSVTVETTGGAIEARLLVGADGLRSPLRRLAGLEMKPGGPRRFGLRQHFGIQPWSPCVEVHMAEGIEAYVTPLAARRVGIAFLWEDGRTRDDVSIENFVSRFPALAERLRGAEACSTAHGAGPMSQSARARTAPRLVLVGDAGGYIDAITGEGLSLAFGSALALARILPDAISSGTTADALASYERQVARSFRHYAFVTRLMLMMARRPALRRRVVRALGRRPGLFELVLRWSVGELSVCN